MNSQFTLTNLLLLIIACTLITILIFQIISRKSKSDETVNKYQPNTQAAIRDVLVASMQKGQLPVAILGIIFIIFSLKMPQKDITSLILETMHTFSKTAALGWTISLFVIITSLMTALMRSKKHKSEISILEKEKSQLLERIQTQANELARITAQKIKK